MFTENELEKKANNYDDIGKVIELNHQSTIRFTVEKHKYFRTVRGGEIKKEVGLIVLKDKTTSRDMIHPFSEYILTNYNGRAIKTQIDYGRDAVTFLNYILDNSKILKINNFSDLQYYHASKFLNEHCGCLARETVKKYRNSLSKFYYFLAKKNILKYCKKDEFTINNVEKKNGRIITSIIAPFPNVDLPEAKVRSRNEHDMPYELQALFLEVAYEEVNIIALGVALQMFGGLRMSEAIRLRYSHIRTIGYYGEQGLLLVLRDDDDGTRPDLSNNDGKGYVKRPRVQHASSPEGLIKEMLRQHSSKYKDINGSDAVFINDNRIPMSYGSYVYYFSILKKKFLERLRNSKNPILKAQSLVLESKRWSTHIGRGIFSNNLVEAVDNPVIAQIERGDLDANSIGVYIANSKRMGKNFEENAENTYKYLLDKMR